MTSTDPAAATGPEVGRLQSTFITSPYQSHPAKWDALWKESYTPWDRGGPSLALADLITSHPNLFPAPSETQRRRAVVPGCGRGYDAVLLSVLGYDVIGLDYSSVAVEEARRNEEKMKGEKVWQEIQAKDRSKEKRSVVWAQGDFFDDGWLEQTGTGKGQFDLIFDYTFFCALPPEARPKWAKRMVELLNPENGRLVCLEWPLGKDPSTGGPPWGLSAEVYLAHLGRPGEEVKYDEDGKLVEEETNVAGSNGGLERLARVKPARTHKPGYDAEGKITDFVSVWGHSLV